MDGDASGVGDGSATATIEAYYRALRDGEPIAPYFADDGVVLKVGIGERLVGPDAVAAGLRAQTAATEGWVVESRDLRVGTATAGRDGDPRFAWFGDDVVMGWTDTERRIRFEFETRWTGALVCRETGWRFVEMHVSAPGET